MTIFNHIKLIILGLALSAAANAGADVVLIVSPKSTTVTLNRSEVADIYLGRTTRLSTGSIVVPIDQVEGSPTRDEFYYTFADKSAIQVKAHWSKIVFTGRGQPPRTAMDASQVKKLVAAKPNVIGYIERSELDASVRMLAIQ